MKEPDFQADKSVLSIAPLSQADDDREYWLSKSPEKRLQGVELLRRTLYDYSDPPPDFKDFLRLLDANTVESLVV